MGDSTKEIINEAVKAMNPPGDKSSIAIQDRNFYEGALKKWTTGAIVDIRERSSGGEVKVGGMTLIEAQAAIEGKLAKFLVSPQVSLFIEEYGNKTVFVMGEVQRPGSLPIPTESRMTVLEAISTAGGFTPIAAQDRTRVLRNVNGVSVSYTIEIKAITQQGQKEKDMVLEPNDVIYVPQSFF